MYVTAIIACFSRFHEMGIYDFAATIDFVLQKTNNNKTSAVGVSVGSGSLLALLSSKPEYNEKLDVVLHLGSGMAFKLDLWLPQFLFTFSWKFPVSKYPEIIIISSVIKQRRWGPSLQLTAERKRAS